MTFHLDVGVYLPLLGTQDRTIVTLVCRVTTPSTQSTTKWMCVKHAIIDVKPVSI